MSSTEIRRANIHDFSELTDIWFNASVKAHDFIPETYWENNKIQMQNTYLPMSEVYLVENTSNIYGFIALVENTIAAIFVSPEQQGKGIGKLLINYAKGMRRSLELNVYQQNTSSVRFYKSVGFKVIEETVDEATNSEEFLMRWDRDI
ncbi:MULTISPECIES: N-acetyltransferase [Acinetobacter]|jgi:putative acetyltransferase|uniref:N-acetyltransferase n=1 Tax=Acinetobacter TaxID=469 RepID=UPI000A32B291|nr:MULTISPECIES: N-acetyltransferase [Acinetobacter]OTG79234.1 N-acetyltransferase [Acinetobacter sp. ANC 4558]TCB12752.1 N-acetyltransferase [Acinetobacter sp. ANC 5045]UJA02838.1 N-acetyltransferase [Acinetobacter johnsonii]